MKIHAFKVEAEDQSAALEDVLALVAAEKKLNKRIRLVAKAEIRIDAIVKKDGLWYMEFAKFRATQGPGRGKKNARVEGFNFKKGETFAEETCALYDPATGYILIQYNHSGVRSGAICNYLSDYDQSARNVYTFNPKFDPDTERRLLKKAIKKRLMFKLDVSAMTAEDIKRGVALRDAVALGQKCEAGIIDIELSAGGDKTNGLRGTVYEVMGSLRDLWQRNPEAVRSLRVAGKTDEDDAIEVLDLLTQRLYVELEDIKPGLDLRLPLEDRWRGLSRARNSWKNILK